MKLYSHITKGLATAVLAGSILSATEQSGFAGPTPKEKLATSVVEPEAPSRVHFLFNMEFANEYVTPRGQVVRDKGLTIQPLFLTFANLYKGEGFINDATLVLGVWNDFGTAGISKQQPAGSLPKTKWTEVDPILGLSFGFAKHFKLDVTYTAFAEQILNLGTSQHIEAKLSADDTALLGAFALHPYISFWHELHHKSTAADAGFAVFGASAKSGAHASPAESWYIDIGISPGYTFADVGSLKVEFPCRIMIPDSRFFGEYAGKSSTIGIYELGVKASMPLKFMPKGYGNWSAHVGYKYMNFNDDNLAYMNTFNAPGTTTRSTSQVYAGVSVFF